MGARSAIQLALAASTILVIIHATPGHLGHQRSGVLPSRAVGDARHQAGLARPIAFVPPSRPASSRDMFGQPPLSVEPNVGQASDDVRVVARGRGDFIARVPKGPAAVDVDASADLALRLEDGDEGRRPRQPLAFPECLMPRNSCGSSIEKQLPIGKQE